MLSLFYFYLILFWFVTLKVVWKVIPWFVCMNPSYRNLNSTFLKRNVGPQGTSGLQSWLSTAAAYSDLWLVHSQAIGFKYLYGLLYCILSWGNSGLSNKSSRSFSDHLFPIQNSTLCMTCQDTSLTQTPCVEERPAPKVKSLSSAWIHLLAKIDLTFHSTIDSILSL